MKANTIRSLAVGLGAIGLALFSLQVRAGYDEHDAQRDCERAIQDRYGYSDIYNVHAERRGHHNKYLITGKIRIHHGSDQHFRCKTKNKQVVDLDIDGYNSYGGGDSYHRNYDRRDSYYGYDRGDRYGDDGYSHRSHGHHNDHRGYGGGGAALVAKDTDAQCKLVSHGRVEYDGGCLLKQKLESGKNIYVVKMDNGEHFRFVDRGHGYEVKANGRWHDARMHDKGDHAVFRWGDNKLKVWE